MHRILLCLITLISLSSHIKAQNETDALRYSRITPGGTARFVSMGGAFGALGGDFSSLSINPAGIGLYRSSELTFTPGFSVSNTGSTFYGNMEEDFNYDFNISNIGLVLAMNRSGQPGEAGFRGFQIGFGFSRLANFNNRSVYDGFNNHSSLMTQYLDIANAENNPLSPGNFDPFTTGLAWETFLLDTLDGQFLVDMVSGGVYQRRETTTSGSIREMSVTLGYNYGDRLYLGAAFGFPRVRFERNFIYIEEEDPLNPNQFFNSLELTDRLNTSGTGFNLKLGVIYRATDMIRLGAAMHTPTFYELNDDFSRTLRSNLSFGSYTGDSPEGEFDYELNTPLRLIGSLGLVFGTRGILSIDYEYADFRQMRLRSNTYMFRAENSVIRNNFDIQHNIRLGGEIRLDPVILRAGYIYNSSPYRGGVNDAVTNTVSAGLGFRDRNFFVDLAFFRSWYSELYYPYSSELTNPVFFDYSRSSLVTTIGLRF